jgi:hypothetical protein
MRALKMKLPSPKGNEDEDGKEFGLTSADWGIFNEALQREYSDDTVLVQVRLGLLDKENDEQLYESPTAPPQATAGSSVPLWPCRSRYDL